MLLAPMSGLWPLLCLLSSLLAARFVAETRKAIFPAGVYVLKGVWFVSIVVYEYVLLVDAPWLPVYLGGTGSDSMWTPQRDDSLGLLYQASLAYHAHSCIASLVMGAKAEMHLHHGVTLSLILASDAYGYRRVGAVVMLLHDVPDIFSALIKGSIAVKHNTATVVAYAGVLLSWGYCRLYLFSQLVWSVLESPNPPMVRYAFATLLGMLLCLHYYWYSLFFVMLYRFRTSGRVKDISETSQAYVEENGKPTPASVHARQD